MKKVLALVLAGLMVSSMSVVSFAADKVADIKFGNEKALYTYDDDHDKMDIVDGETALDANTTYYLEVVDEAGAMELDKLSKLNDVKVRTSISTGSSYISSKATSFVIKTVKENNVKVKKAYVSFTTADKFQMEEQDIELTITLYDNDGNSTDTKDIAASVGYGESYAKPYFKVDGPVVKFEDIDDNDEIEIEFSNDDVDNVIFKVAAKGQKDLFLRMDTDVPEALEDKFPSADITAVLFAGNNKTFKKTGELTIPVDAKYIYSYEDGKLAVLEDAKYDDGKDEWTIKTNKLGNYILSDTELVAADAEGEKGTDAETNPDTGANDFVGLAVALAVVSVAGIAVAKRK